MHALGVSSCSSYRTDFLASGCLVISEDDGLAAVRGGAYLIARTGVVQRPALGLGEEYLEVETSGSLSGMQFELDDLIRWVPCVRSVV